MRRFTGNRIPDDKSTKDSASPGDANASERRRLGRVVHDDRGSASVEWHDAPDDYERPVFRVAGTGVKDPLTIKNDDTFNPYDRVPDSSPSMGGDTSKSGKRDLKKLSAWLKLMREMEERKKNGQD